MSNFENDPALETFIPFVTQESAIGREIAAKNRLRQSGLYCLILAHFAAVDFWQRSPIQ